MSRITALETADVRFPTSLPLDGSDAMNPDPDYSAAYVRLTTDAATGSPDTGSCSPSGAATTCRSPRSRRSRATSSAGTSSRCSADMGGTWRELVHDSQLRWLGPEKGVMHMAIGAVVNALWDLRAKRAGRPLWQLLAAMTPEELVDLVDFRYLTDALTRDEALEILRAAEPGRAEREARLLREGYPAYTTTPGWLGYDDEKLDRLCREAVAEGFDQIKLKVGGDLADDVRRLGIARDAVGPDVRIAVDANQRWDVADAIAWIKELASFDLAWVEEPTSPDDVLGHAAIARGIAPIPVATGEHMANRVMAKQFLAARRAAGAPDRRHARGRASTRTSRSCCSRPSSACRCARTPAGSGLCEAVQHLAMFDYVAVSGRLDGRMIEFVDHLHEHFVTPVEVAGGRYRTPTEPGAGTEMLAASLAGHTVARDG